MVLLQNCLRTWGEGWRPGRDEGLRGGDRFDRMARKLDHQVQLGIPLDESIKYSNKYGPETYQSNNWGIGSVVRAGSCSAAEAEMRKENPASKRRKEYERILSPAKILTCLDSETHIRRCPPTHPSNKKSLKTVDVRQSPPWYPRMFNVWKIFLGNNIFQASECPEDV